MTAPDCPVCDTDPTLPRGCSRCEPVAELEHARLTTHTARRTRALTEQIAAAYAELCQRAARVAAGLEPEYIDRPEYIDHDRRNP